MTLNSNEATEMGYANGVMGRGVHLELDAREPAHSGALVWELEYVPIAMHFRPDDPKHPQLPHAPPGVLIIKPKSVTFNFDVPARLRPHLRAKLEAATCATLKVQRGVRRCGQS